MFFGEENVKSKMYKKISKRYNCSTNIILSETLFVDYHNHIFNCFTASYLKNVFFQIKVMWHDQNAEKNRKFINIMLVNGVKLSKAY